MKTTRILLLCLIQITLSYTGAKAQPLEKRNDKTASPYFEIISDEPGADKLPLKSTRAEVNIAGVIAGVTIIQEYKNDEGRSPIEAIYVFPASTRAAIYRMVMTIGGRTIEAQIRERSHARQEYEQAKQDGKTASLLEQQRPNVFQMNVANIMPGDLVKVELRYTELLIPEDGVYEFIYPTVVGPRYHGEKQQALASASEGWLENPYTSEGLPPTYDFGITVNISAGMPLRDLRSTSHQVALTYFDASSARADLSPSEKLGGNRDFILQYRLRGDRMETGMMLYQSGDENFFLAMVQPPRNVNIKMVPPREYVFIVDVSGSMYGYPLNTSKQLLRDLIGNLRPTDRFNVVLFAGGASVLSEASLPASAENISKAISHIEQQQGGGGTNLLAALNKALSLKGTEDYSRTFIIATDGYVAVEKEAFDLVRQNLNKANFFAFGIGTAVNRYIIEGLAHVGNGEAFVITKPEEASAEATRFRKYVEHPLLTNIELKFEGFEAYDVEPSAICDVMAERPLVIRGKWKGMPAGRMILTGTSGEGQYRQEIEIGRIKPGLQNAALRYLWARERIRLLDDYGSIGAAGKEHTDAITSLGLRYNLMTAYTSFVAVDSEVRNQGGQLSTVTQPLPLPQGVSNQATGNISGASGMYYTPLNSSGSSYENVSVSKFKMVQGINIEMQEDVSAPVYTIASETASFKGGEAALEEFIAKNLRYPDEARITGITGKVMVELEIATDGSIKNLKVVRGLHPSLDREAIRVLKLTTGKWIAGRQDGKAVTSRIIVPVEFVL